MSEVPRWTPYDTTISDITWVNLPDKYNPPAQFDKLKRAREYDSSGWLTAEVRLCNPDFESWTAAAVSWDEAIADIKTTGAKVIGRRYRVKDGRGETMFDTPEDVIASGKRGTVTEELRFVARTGEFFWMNLGPTKLDNG